MVLSSSSLGKPLRLTAEEIEMLRRQRVQDEEMWDGAGFGDFGDLGWGWKSVKGFAKKVGGGVVKIGKGSYNLAKLPAAAARRVANASSSILCDKSGNPRGSDATSRNFCRAVKFRQQASLKRYLPGAAAMASKIAQTKKRVDLVQQALRAQPLRGAEPDVNLLASLAGADMDELSFALAEVTPGDMGAVLTKENAYLFAPSLLAVGAGLWMLYKG